MVDSWFVKYIREGEKMPYGFTGCDYEPRCKVYKTYRIGFKWIIRLIDKLDDAYWKYIAHTSRVREDWQKAYDEGYKQGIHDGREH